MSNSKVDIESFTRGHNLNLKLRLRWGGKEGGVKKFIEM